MDNNIIILSRRSKHPNMNINSRSGSMLVLVLVILAVSIILITSALMISAAGRQRYYKDAEREQASLTAMSAARLICQAVVNNKISSVYTEPDTCTLEELARNGAVVNLSSSGIPGLAGTAETNPESNSYAVFGYYETDPPDGKQYISVTVTTVLDAVVSNTASEAEEKVTVLLEKVRTPSKLFNNLITIGIQDQTENTINKLQIGSDAVSVLTEDGYVVVHGDITFKGGNASGTPKVNCNVVFTGNVKVGQGNSMDFNSNVVFYGEDASIFVGSSQINVIGDIFFLRNTVANVFTKYSPSNGTRSVIEDGGPPIDTRGVYLLNSNMNSSSVSAPDGIVVGDNSEVYPANEKLAVEPTITDLKTLAYTLSTSIQASVSRKVLTTDQAKSLFQYTTDSQLPTFELFNEDKIITQPGTYYIDLQHTSSLSESLIFDLTAGKISLYIIDSAPVTGNDLSVTGSINFINGNVGANKVGKILLLDGADITIGAQGNREGAITGTVLSNLPITIPVTITSVSAEPFLFIYGLGECEVNNPKNPNKIFLENGTLQGYIGLFGTMGDLSIGGGQNCTLYARYEGAYFLRSGQGSNNTDFPYCPAPAGSPDGSTYTVTYKSAGYIVGPIT